MRPAWPTRSSSPTPATRSACPRAVEQAGGPADVTVVCVDVPGCEGGAILSTAPGGTVIFFSMATSFTAAALGAEGAAADVTMLVGNGYVPGHAELALDLIRAEPGVRALFDRRIDESGSPEAGQAGHPRQRSNGGSSQLARHGSGPRGPDRPVTRRLSLDPALVREARRAGPPGPAQPIVDMARTHTTVSVERAVLRLAGLQGADDDGMPWVNRLRRRRPRQPPAWSTAWPCPPGTRCAPATTPTWARWPAPRPPARCRSGSPAAPTRTPPGTPQRPPWPPASPGSTPSAPPATR